MKKFILCVVFAIVSIASFGQSDSIYVAPHSSTYHVSKTCEKLKSVKNAYDLKTIKPQHFLSLVPCKRCVEKEASKEMVNFVKTNKPFIMNNVSGQTAMLEAGKYQCKSASYHYAAFGLAVAGGVLCVLPSIASGDDFKNGTTGDICYGIGGACGLAAVVCELCAINFQLKSGQNLKIAANKIQYTF